MTRARSVTRKLIDSHLVNQSSRDPAPGEEVAIRIDQTLTQDATGTLVMLALEAMDLDRVKTEVSAQYVDHNMLQEDHKNPDDHLFLESACRRFGVRFSRPGNGVSHPVHMQRLGRPGATMLGSDSHTPAAGALGMLAIGVGGLEVAMAMAGQPYYLRMPEVWKVRLTGELPPWVSAKDVILEMLRRHDVDGGVGRVIEYTGPGLVSLSAMDRHVIANMGTELGATTTVFPSDDETRRFLRSQGREDAWEEILADGGAEYELEEELDLSELGPLVAKPSSPGNVVPVSEVAGEPIYQAYLGSSANPGFADFAIAADIVKGKRIPEAVSFDVNPTSRQQLREMMQEGVLGALIAAGARLHQAGCNGCIGMGQAPATGKNSLRTVPRNFPGRSGTREDRVFLCSPETAAASALAGAIADPRQMKIDYPGRREPESPVIDEAALTQPLSPEDARRVELVKGPNVDRMPTFDPLPDEIEVEVALRVDDNISTDEIMPAGANVLPLRSNIPAIAEYCFRWVDEHYVERAKELDGHAIVGGRNYGQGSSREHAAIAPAYLGLKVVLAESFARIHWRNLANMGVLPLSIDDADAFERGDRISLRGLRDAMAGGETEIEVRVGEDRTVTARCDLSKRQRAMVLAGGLINWQRQQDRG